MRFECPGCKQLLEIQSMYSGQTVACPLCNAQITIPDATPQSVPASTGIPSEQQPDGQPSTTGISKGGMTIAKFMADQQIQGGVELDQSAKAETAASEVLTTELETKYRIGDIVAKGGMGAILNAKDTNLRRNVAMKVMLDPRSASQARIMRFIEEAQITGQLEHPCIVPLHDLGVDAAGNVFYTMKFIKGKTLLDVLRSIESGDEETIKDYPISSLLTIFQKICDAIAFAHSKRVIHRDLKPENVMLGDYGEVLIMDWGLSKVLPKKRVRKAPAVARGAMAGRQSLRGAESEIGIRHSLPAPDSRQAGTIDIPVDSVRGDEAGEILKTIDGAIMGTPGFMSPEQALGKTEEIDERTDIYALGAILYNILTLNAPIKGTDLAEMIDKTSTGAIPPPTTFNTSTRITRFSKPGTGEGQADDRPDLRHLPDKRVPESLSAVCMKALAVDPWKRYQKVKELQKEIEAYQNGFATTAERAGILRQIQLFVTRHKTVTVMAVFIVLFVAAAAVVSLTQWMVARKAAETANKEQQTARKALGALRECAPDMIQLAKMFIEKKDISEASKKLSYAIELVPENAEYRYLQGNAFQTLLMLKDAENSYSEALKLDPNHRPARENLELCKQLIEERRNLKQTSISAACKLYCAIRQQGRLDEAIALGGRIMRGAGGTKPMEETLAEILSNAGLKYKRLATAPDGTCIVDLNNTDTADISALRGMPLTELNLNRTKAADLTALKGLPLEHLNVGYTSVSDLSPLKGMRLKRLVTDHNLVTDITPLTGMPLENLDLWSDNVKDISCLKGMPLRRLILNTTSVSDFSVLKDLPLVELEISNTEFNDLSILKGLKLTSLALSGLKGINNLSAIAGMPLRSLFLASSGINDLSQLKGLPLDFVDIHYLPITDLTPLLEVPLKGLGLDNREAASLWQLRSMTNLTWVGGFGFKPSLFHGSCIRAITKKDYARARQEAEKIIADWKGFPAMADICKAGQLYLNLFIPIAEKNGQIPNQAVEFRGHHYLFCTLPVSWPDAKTFCEAMNGHLVTITDAEEHQFVRRIGGGAGDYWLGFVIQKDGTPEWVTKETWNYGKVVFKDPPNAIHGSTAYKEFGAFGSYAERFFVLEWDH